MNLKDCHNVEDFRKLAKKNYHLQFFIILMVDLTMKLLLKEIQNLLINVI